MELFKNKIGTFRGFKEGGLEFHADLVLPFDREKFRNVPMHGQFVLVQLETPDEAVLGRIASFSSEGKLVFGSGEEFSIRAMQEEQEVPDDLREQYLKYKVNIRVLGVLRKKSDTELTFVASHRRLPHVGSPGAFPDEEVLRDIAGHYLKGAAIGHFALGEYIYAAGHPHFQSADWMQVKEPEVLIKFPIENLVSRRSFVFARAGFGKSNLNKLLFSKLYADTPSVEKRGGRKVPVGTVIFDPDGEYFWPDDKGRPGLCDVEHLQDKLVVFTSREAPSPFYQSFVVSGIKLDIRCLPPSDVVSIALSSDKQDQQNVRKLRALTMEKWEKLVNLIDRYKNDSPLAELGKLLNLDEGKQEMEAIAARSNMTIIVNMLHDKSSQLLDMLIMALMEGKLCIVDISQMRGMQGMVLAGLLLRRIFERNQQEFTKAQPRTIPTIAVIEEAQAVLNDQASAAEPYIAWVKEGRKYDLGALLITQQPGSIPVDILSQGDNWFIFHLLSAADLNNVRKANAHYSEDLLSSLLNEPIPGQGVFWSSVGGKAYPVSLRVLSFEQLYKPLDPHYNRGAEETFARQLKAKFQSLLVETVVAPGNNSVESPSTSSNNTEVDAKLQMEKMIIEKLRNHSEFRQKIKEGYGLPWGRIIGYILEIAPTLDGTPGVSFLVRKALEEIFGEENKGWYSYKKETKKGEMIFVKLGSPPQERKSN